MGDKIRAKLGIDMTWSGRDKKDYLEYRKKELGPLYMMEGISLESPALRADYLDRKLYVNDRSALGLTVLANVKSKGKGLALVTIEEWAISKFF